MFSSKARLALRKAIQENLRIQETLLENDKADIVCTDVSLNKISVPIQLVSTWSIMGFAPGKKYLGISLYLPFSEDPLCELFKRCTAIKYNPQDITTLNSFESEVFYEDPAAAGCFFSMSVDNDKLEEQFVNIFENFLLLKNTSALKFNTWTN